MGEFSLFLPQPQSRGPAAGAKRIFTTLPPPDPSEEANKGLVVIQGSGAKVMTLNETHNGSVSRSVHKEVQRTSDLVRIKNPRAPEQHVDVLRPREIKTSPTAVGPGASVPAMRIVYAPQPPGERADDGTPVTEVLETGIVEKNPEWTGGGGGGAAP